jgi:RNA ligase
MKQYDEIKYYGDYWGLPIIAFDKIDGSNLRFEYSQKRGFYKFGTRNMMIDSSHPEFGFAVKLFLDKYAEKLTKIFKSKDYRNSLSFVCYSELIGSKSEFGQHDFSNDKFDIILFDVDEYKKGFIPPKQFVKHFKECGIPKVVYEGNLNREFVQSIKRNEYNLSEGVICKGVIPNKKENNLFYCKIKTDDWFERLRNKRPDLYIEELKQANRSVEM